MGLVLRGGCYGFIPFPFTHFRMMFPSLSYSFVFQSFPSLNSPTAFPPLDKVIIVYEKCPLLCALLKVSGSSFFSPQEIIVIFKFSIYILSDIVTFFII